ncbi:MAG: hypothetical protein LBG59_08205 [Candidatus Peribacteria bacterium]|nr:hypothetical protein [Candidatus Peribacteria bacterium]
MQFTGHWVKLLLGEEHHKRFVKQYKLKQAEFDAQKGEHKTKDGHIMDVQAKAEMLYIVNQLDERGGDNDSFFGFQQNIKPTNKNRLSAQFAIELETRYKEYISEDKLKEGVNKQRDNTNFQNAYNEFKRFGLSDRPAKALPFIQRMAEMAKTPAQFSKLQEVLLFGLVSGYFRFLPQSWKGRLEQLSRSMAFTPGMMAIEGRHPEKIAHLLDVLTEGKFSKLKNEKGEERTWSHFDNNPDKPKDKDFYKKYFNTFSKFWNTNGMGRVISDGIQTIHLRDAKDDEIIAYIQKREIELQNDHVNEDVLGNGRLAKWNALGKSKATFDALTKYRNGKFEAKDSDMEQAMEDFW